MFRNGGIVTPGDREIVESSGQKVHGEGVNGVPMRGIDAPSYLVVDMRPEEVLRQTADGVRCVIGVSAVMAEVVECVGVRRKRVLFAEGENDESVKNGLESGDFTHLLVEDVIASLEAMREKTVLAITGGGDCAGIADCMASIAKHLRDFVVLGVKNAGKGLIKEPAEFGRDVIPVSRLLLEDFLGQSSTPFGSARENALEVNPDNTLANIGGRGAVVGTGGDDHLGLLARIAEASPGSCVVVTPKTIDADVKINGKAVQCLGFNSAVSVYREAIYSFAASVGGHDEVSVVETFGRKAGRLAFEAARKDPPNFDELGKEVRRKIEDFGDAVMILVPEKPVAFAAVVREVLRIKEREGSCVVVVAEGFMPPELKSEFDRLSRDDDLRERWQSKDGEEKLKVEEIAGLIQYDGEEDPRNDLKLILEDRGLAAEFARMIWDGKLDGFGNGAKLSGIRNFIAAAIKRFGEFSKVNLSEVNYEGRGADPNMYDQEMGRKIGVEIARLVRSGVTGGKAVVYLEGMDVMNEAPVVVDLVGVSNKNNLSNPDLYPDEVLRRGGVFWE